MIPVAVGGLAVVGLVISAYFTAVVYRWMRPDPAWIPTVCQLEEQTCASVVFTPRARIFGLPNSVLGLAYYTVLLIGVSTGAMWASPWHGLFVAAATGTVVLAAYLAYSLIWVLQVPCRLCFVSHLINLTLLGLLLAS